MADYLGKKRKLNGERPYFLTSVKRKTRRKFPRGYVLKHIGQLTAFDALTKWKKLLGKVSVKNEKSKNMKQGIILLESHTQRVKRGSHY